MMAFSKVVTMTTRASKLNKGNNIMNMLVMTTTVLSRILNRNLSLGSLTTASHRLGSHPTALVMEEDSLLVPS